MAPHHHSVINHPCYPKHPLSFLSSAPYPQGIFNCDACSRPDKGFFYHCKECKFDLHVHCASLPLSVNHNSHPQHYLTLTYQIPYPTKDFSCDICNKNSGSKCWIYHYLFLHYYYYYFLDGLGIRFEKNEEGRWYLMFLVIRIIVG
ncbi:hypothetical protein MKW98_030645 [Papaver atlanticum]|uniref:DC1 domain-containing protein n=1 Tax=Papaver atlanticum TaxID=357466 RepID=A0AAD4X3D5_9MAGN|nr:hypothetical protein MKW98_030645 [Papaver atlanticum]